MKLQDLKEKKPGLPMLLLSSQIVIKWSESEKYTKHNIFLSLLLKLPLSLKWSNGASL